jgi:hypothetical protein
MPWHINKTNVNIAQIQFGKTYVNRDAAFFLFGQTVCINARQ